MSEASTAVSAASPSSRRSPAASATPSRPSGSDISAPTTRATNSPPSPGISAPLVAPVWMYAAQQPAASSANSTPIGSSATPVIESMPMSAMPAAASPTHTRSRARRESTADSSSGPRNSIATAVPSGMRSIAA